jgi:hypothetical protein
VSSSAFSKVCQLLLLLLKMIDSSGILDPACPEAKTLECVVSFILLKDITLSKCRLEPGFQFLPNKGHSQVI